ALCAAFSPDGKLLASGYGGSERKDSGSFCIWDAATGKELQHIENHYGGVVRLAFSSDAQRLTTAGRDRTLRQWQGSTGEELSQFLGAVQTPHGQHLTVR